MGNGETASWASEPVGLKKKQSVVPMNCKGYYDTNVVLTWVKHWLILALENR